MSDISYWIYKWDGSPIRRNVDLNRCRYRLFHDYFPFQCSRKPKHSIGSYGLCKQHAKMLVKRYDIEMLPYEED